MVANTLAPYVLLPPLALVPLPALQVLVEPPSVLENMNLSRVHSSDEFRQAFKTSLRVHHPDHGGSQEVFQQIQGLKKIMGREKNYFDLYNLTDSDLSSANVRIEESVAIKKYSYFVESGIFYFITLLYVLAFTLDGEANSPRFYLLALIAVFALY